MRIRPLILFLWGAAFMLLVLAGCSRDSSPTAGAVSDQPIGQATSELPKTEPIEEPDEALPAPAAGISDDVIATVNGMPISSAQFERTRQQVLSQYQQIYSQFGQDVRTMLGGAQGRLFDLRISDGALEQATARALILGELDRQDAAVTQSEVTEEFNRQFDGLLAYLGMDEASFQAAYENGTLVDIQTGDLTYAEFITNATQTIREQLETQAIQTLIAGAIEHSPEALVAYFAEHRSSYGIPEQVRASHILVEDEAVAQRLLDELNAGGDFAALAQEYSIDTSSALRGGDLGWFGRGRMVAPFEEAAFATPVGEHSGIVATKYGYHIIWVTDYQPSEQPTYEDVADAVTADYKAEVKSQRFNEWYALARPEANVVILDPILDAFRKQQDDLETGLKAFLAVRDAGTSNDDYLNYIIGSIYETLMDQAVSEKRGIEGNETLTPTQQEQVAALESEIEDYRSQAVAFYKTALAALGAEPEIETRIENLTPDTGG